MLNNKKLFKIKCFNINKYKHKYNNNNKIN